MSSRENAIQYAKGLFGVAVSDADPRLIGEELKAFAALVEAQPDLRRVLTSPAIPGDRKAAVLGDISRLSPIAPLVQHFLGMLARHGALGQLPEIVEEYEARLMHHLRIVTAEVTTAVPLSADDEAALAKRLADATGKQVRVATAVDPSIVGGVVTRIGSVVYDGSVRRQLERLREQFTERA